MTISSFNLEHGSFSFVRISFCQKLLKLTKCISLEPNPDLINVGIATEITLTLEGKKNLFLLQKGPKRSFFIN